jgi:hypothetical protein
MLHVASHRDADLHDAPGSLLHKIPLALMIVVHRGTRPRMASKTERIQFLRAVRQLHRVRSFYAVGVLLWAASAAWTGWQAPGSRQMWVSVLLLAVFTGLLTTAALSLWRLTVPPTGRPAHHAAPRKAASTRHVHA